MSFWQSDFGDISGKPEDAFTQAFTPGNIPNDTMALAEIVKFTQKEYQGSEYYQIDWKLTDGDYKGRIVFQKLHCFDQDPKKRHKALNMMKMLYIMFTVKPKDGTPPLDADLKVFAGKKAGIKIQEWHSNGKEGNWVSEVHPIAGFQSATGNKLEPVAQYGASAVNSALTRHAENKIANILLIDDDDIPF